MEFSLAYKRYLEQGRQIFTDSRNIIKDGVFLALHGKHFDGNEYALEAIDKGAAYAIVDRKTHNDHRLILVEDTLTELQSMALLNRKINKAKIIAITGSNGKTTTKELCLSIFKLAFNTIATQGNFNNHIGVPLTLLRITEETDYAIIEMGANQPGDINELCKIAEPEIGLITNIGKAHLEGFGSLSGVIKAKMELFDYLIQHHGVCVYNMCSEQIKKLFQGQSDSIRFGDISQEAEYHGTLLQSFPTIELKFSNNDQEITLRSSLFGEYNYQNILAASTLASICGISSRFIQKGVTDYIPDNMRSQIIQMNGNTVLLDAYNANPSSMKAAIEIFDKMDFNTKWILLGEMAEMGDHKESEHRELLNLVKSKNFEKKIWIGKTYGICQNEPGMMYFENVMECKNWLNMNWPKDTAMLIKGSRSSYLEKLIH